MIRVFLDNVEISNRVEIDLSFVEKLDMELDEGFLVLAHSTRKNPFEMFTTIDIYENQQIIFTGKISQDNVSLSSYSDELFNHSITIIEHTKVLEKFLITGKTFTQPTDETTVPFYTLYDVIESLRKTTNFSLFGNEELNTPFEIPQEVKDELELIIAPEFSFKDVTLRQALNEVLFYIDSIVRLDRENNIVIDKFNELKNEIDFLTENFKRDQNILDYSTIMSSDIQNSVNTGMGFAKYNYEYYPGKDLWTTLRSPSITQFDFENSFITTPKPIYNVQQLITVADIRIVSSDSETPEGATIVELFDEDFINFDITSNLVEKSIYVTLEEKDPDTFDELTKKNTVYYEYGKKGIQLGETFGIFDIQTVFPLLIESTTQRFAFENNFIPSGATPTPKPSGFDYGFFKDGLYYWVKADFVGNIADTITFSRWKNLFRIKYTPILPSIRYEVVRDDVSEVFVETKSTANQKLRIVDLERFTNNMKGRINQLGNSELVLSHKVGSISETFNIGDFTTEKFVITKKEVIVQRDHYIVNYELNKNFNKISQFMGIDQEIRQYEIGEAGRTLDRDLNYNEYVEIYADDNGQSDTGSSTLIQSSILLNTLNSSYDALNFARYSIFTSPQLLDDSNNQIPINLPVYRVSGGNAFGFYMDFDSNISSGDQLVQGGEGFLNPEVLRRYNIPLKYTDEIGRLETFLVSVHDGILFPEADFDEEIDAANALPLFTRTFSNQFMSGSFYVEKDNRERLKMTFLYHLLSKNLGEVVIGELFSTNNAFFIEEPNTVELRAWNDRTFLIRDKNRLLNNEDLKITNPNITFNYNENYFEINDDISSYGSWALTDSEGFPYIMVNSNKKRIVFEFKAFRSDVDFGFEVPEGNLKRPTLITSSSTSDSVTFVLGNPNEEDVDIEVTLGQNTQTQEVLLENQSSNFTFTNLEPNRNFAILAKCVPKTSSILLASQERTFSENTQIIPIDAPIFVLDSVEDGDLVDRERQPGGTLNFFAPEVRAYKVGVKIFNGNPQRVRVFGELDGQDVTSISEGPIIIDGNSNDVFFFEKKYSNPITLVPDPNDIFGNTRIMPEEDYPFRFRVRTEDFTNNWFSPYSLSGNINISLPTAVTPDITWIPTSTENEIIFNINNQQSYEMTYEVDLQYQNNTVKNVINQSIDANSNVNVTFVNTSNDNIPNSLSAFDEFTGVVRASAEGFNDGSSKTATGRFAGEAKPPTYQFISKTSTNSTSSFTYKLTNIERYEGRIYYEANTFSSSFTPTDFEIVGSNQSITKTFNVPSNNINDLHYVHFYMAEDPPAADIPEVIADSGTVVSPSITPEPFITEFTVNFLDIDGNVISTILKDDGENLQLNDFPGAPVENGYNFIDWYDSAQLTNVVTQGYTITNNLDIYPRYDVITYNITYELDGGTNDSANPSTYTVEDTFTLQPASRVGYEFDGWYSDSLFISQVTTISAGTTGNITLYAKLDRLFLEDVTFDLIDSTFTTLTVRATNPSNQRSDANVGFWLGLYEGSTQIETTTQYIFTGPGDTIDVLFENLDDNTEYTLASFSPPQEIEVFDTNNIYDDLLLPTQSFTTPEIIGDKVLEVIINPGGALGDFSGTFNYDVNSVPQNSVTVNSTAYTTIRSNLLDNDTVTLFAPNISGLTFEHYIINNTQVNTSTTNQLVDQGLSVEIVYS